MDDEEVEAPLPGTALKEVAVTIDHAIIQHFSQHLYSSPNKAIEELVVNGYDAGASNVLVYLEGQYTHSSVVVLDDGDSMDEMGLRRLWWVARSPKNAPGARRVGNRDVIGKFGIGKLAAYALGTRIAHLAHRGDHYLLVDFDFSQINLLDDGEPSSDEPKQQEVKAPMRSLSRDEAEAWLATLFNTGTLPRAASELFKEPQWTVAVVQDLRELDSPIYAGVLRRVLGNGLPNRPGFTMWVNDDEAKQVLTAKQPAHDLDGLSDEIRRQIITDWEVAKSEGVVSGDVVFSEGETAFTVSQLGDIKVELRVYADSLLERGSAEIGRSFGFFVMVRGRLLNEDDYQHLLHDPSFGALYRSQIVIWADGLDRALLADRERLSSSRPETRALRIIEQALYRVARRLTDKMQEKAHIEQMVSSILPTNLRELWHDPLAGYSAAHHQEERFPNPENDDFLARQPVGVDSPVAAYDGDDGNFSINTAHPFRSAIERQIGGGQRGNKIRRLFDVFAVSEVLLEGYMIDQGLGTDVAAAVISWRDGFFREVARRFQQGPDELQEKARELSYGGDAPFELALRDLFIDMGFRAVRVAGSGNTDVLVVAPIGPGQYKVAVEAKGSRDPVGNLRAHVGGVASHREKVGAAHGIIVARDFAGIAQNGSEAAVLEECKAVGGVSAVRLDVLFELHDLLHRYHYPLDVVLGLLQPVQTPDEMRESLADLARPNAAFNYPAVLEAIWERQQTHAEGEVVYYQSVRQDNAEWKAAITREEMDAQMLWLERASGGLVHVDSDQKTVVMRQSPEMVLDSVRAMLEGEGHVHPTMGGMSA